MTFQRSRLNAVLSANTLLRTATTASGANTLVGFYLAALAINDDSINAALVGNLNASFDAAALLLAVPFGTLIDRYSPRAVLIFGTILGAIATQLFGIAGVIPIFFLSRILEGVANSATQPSVLSHLTDATNDVPALRGRVMSWFEISLFLGIALGNLISGPLWTFFNTSSFSILAVLYVLAALVFFWGTQVDRSVKLKPANSITFREAFQGFATAMREPMLQRLALPWLIFNAVIGLWISQLAFQLNGPQREGQWLVGRLSAQQISLFLFVYTIVFAVGVYYYGVQIGRKSRTRIMRVGFISMYATSICFLLMNLSTGWAPWMRFAILPPYALAVAIQGGFTPAALSYLADVAGKSAGRGSAMGLYTLLLSLGNIIGSLFGGYIASRYAFNGLIAGTFVLGTLGILSMRGLPNADPLMNNASDIEATIIN